MYRYYLLVHIIICSVIYFIYVKKSRNEAIYRTAVVFFIPILGFLMFLFLYIVKIIKKDEPDILDSYSKYIESEVIESPFNKVNFQKEINIVPLTEALELNSNAVKRTVIIDLLKDEHLAYIGELLKALENEDTETSHYAATAISEIKSNFIKDLMEITKKHEENPNDRDILIEFINILKSYINSDLLDVKSREKHYNKYSKLLEELLQVYTEEKQYFIDKIDCEIELKNFTLAKIYCDKFLNVYKNSEDAYISYLKLFYALFDYDGIKRTISLMKQSPIKFTNKTLNIIRFWTEGENDVI